MDAIEKAIRNAFEKGNADDRAFRERVYRSAFAALDRALQANPGITVESAIKRRKALQAKIDEIETEFQPAVPDVAVPTQAGAGEVPSVAVPAAGREPLVQGPEPVAPEPAVEPRRGFFGKRRAATQPADAPEEPALPGSRPVAARPGGPEVAPDRDERRARRGRFPFAGPLLTLLVLVALAAGGWWGVKTGLVRLPALSGSGAGAPEEEGSAPPLTAGPLKPGQPDRNADWITVFSPDDPGNVSAPSDAAADVMTDDTGAFVRIRSGASGSAVGFDVGQGVLEKLAGKHAVFDIVARAEEGKDTQMAVDCNFGELGDCGRRRYAVGRQRNEYLFDLHLPDKQPGAAGTIAIVPDFDKQGRSVDIYEIRVSVVP